MRFDRPLDDLFARASSVKVLRALAGLPAGFGVSAREIGRRAGVSHPTASKVLGGLAEQGLVSLRRSSTADEYAFNLDHSLSAQIVDLFELERSARSDLIRFLGESLRRVARDVQEAYLFGSVVWGEMGPDSDVDVGIVCPLDAWERERVMPKIGEDVRKRYGNRLTWMVIDPGTIARLPLARSRVPPVWRRILEEGIPIPLRGEKAAGRGA